MDSKSCELLVLGASLSPLRYSYRTIMLAQERGISTMGIGRQPGQIGQVNITDGIIPLDDVHTISMYLRPPLQQMYLDYILTLKPERIIFNPGTENPGIYDLLDDQAVECLEACTMTMLITNQFI